MAEPQEWGDRFDHEPPDRRERDIRVNEPPSRLAEPSHRPADTSGRQHERQPRRQRDEPHYSVEDTAIVNPRAMLAVRSGQELAVLDDDEEARPVREWLLTIVQLVTGAVAGAVLWLVFQWLWRTQPMIAAVAGVLITVVAILLVRRIWRSNDLRSTVMTLLIGLFVTMSPAVLLLDL
jgi:hypothetical protein